MPSASFAGANDATAPLSAIADRRRNLAERVLSGLVLGPAAIALVVLGGPAFEIATAGAAGLGLREWLKIVNGTGPLWSIALPGALVAAYWVGGVAAAAFVLVALTLALFLLGRGGTGARGQAAFGLPYVGLTLIALVWLRGAQGAGWPLVMFALFMVWATDIGAYFVGRAIGGPRLAPRISPNKTWAGFVGGVALAVLVALAWRTALSGTINGWGMVALAVVLSLVGQAGDLFESAVKRRFGVKDSGTLIPGHGGILDRIDALLLAAPVAALLHAVGLTAGVSS